MSVVAFVNGTFGADRKARLWVDGLPVVGEMQKAFISTANDFFYGYSGYNIVMRQHPQLQALLRQIITAVVKGDNYDDALERLDGAFRSQPHYIFGTRDLVLTIATDNRRLQEYDPTDLVAIGSGALCFRVAYRLHDGRFRKAMRDSSAHSNGITSDLNVFKISKLQEFIPCA